MHDPPRDASTPQRVWQHVLRVPRAERRVLARLRRLGLDVRPSDTVEGVHVVESVGDRTDAEIRAVVDRCAPQTEVLRLRSLPQRLDGPATAPLDFDPDDEAEPCAWCTRWYAQRCLDHGGEPVLREWHHPRCPHVVEWGEESLS